MTKVRFVELKGIDVGGLTLNNVYEVNQEKDSIGRTVNILDDDGEVNVLLEGEWEYVNE